MHANHEAPKTVDARRCDREDTHATINFDFPPERGGFHLVGSKFDPPTAFSSSPQIIEIAVDSIRDKAWVDREGRCVGFSRSWTTMWRGRGGTSSKSSSTGCGASNTGVTTLPGSRSMPISVRLWPSTRGRVMTAERRRPGCHTIRPRPSFSGRRGRSSPLSDPSTLVRRKFFWFSSQILLVSR